MTAEIEKLKHIILPVLEAANVYLVEMQLRGQPNSQVLSIYLDTENGITLQQIADLTREIEGLLDLEDPIRGKYRLDVSSPGTDRPLTEIWQFRKNLGRNLHLVLQHQDGISEKAGILRAVEEDHIVIVEKKSSWKIPLSEIKKAVVKLNW